MRKETRDVGEIGNYYGGLSIKEDDGKFYWSIENYCGDNWYEIPESLYLEILKHYENINQ